MDKEKINALWPIYFTAEIDGIQILYDSTTQSFTYDEINYNLNLGKSTYGQIKGFLTLPIVEFQRLNYNRSQAHLPLFKSIREATINCLKTQTDLTLLIFLAQGILTKEGTFLEETKLLKMREYTVIKNYKPQTVDEALSFLIYFSRLQTQKERNVCFGISEDIQFIWVRVESDKGHYVFCNDNLVTRPKNISIDLFSDEQGKIMARYEFDTIKILNKQFKCYTAPYFTGIIKGFTLVNNEPYPIYSYEPIVKPNYCPTCLKPIERTRCMNAFCKSKIIHCTHYIASRNVLNIPGLSKNTLSLLYDTLIKVHQVPENRIHPLFFFYFNLEELEKVMQKKESAQLLYNAISHAKKHQSLSQLIYSLQIPEITKKEAKEISDKYHNNIDKLIRAIKEKEEDLFEPHHLNLLELYKNYIDCID